jgi:hypothetical protein
MAKWNGSGRYWSNSNTGTLPAPPERSEELNEKHQSGMPMSERKFEPISSQIRIQIVTATPF